MMVKPVPGLLLTSAVVVATSTIAQAGQLSMPPSFTAQPDPGALISLSAPASEPGRGQAVYNGTCIACHGGDGTGSLPGVPDLTGKTGLLSQDDAILLGRMADGFQSPGSSMAMPPKGGNPALTDADLSAVLKYMRNEFQQDPQTGRKPQ